MQNAGKGKGGQQRIDQSASGSIRAIFRERRSDVQRDQQRIIEMRTIASRVRRLQMSAVVKRSLFDITYQEVRGQPGGAKMMEAINAANNDLQQLEQCCRDIEAAFGGWSNLSQLAPDLTPGQRQQVDQLLQQGELSLRELNTYDRYWSQVFGADEKWQTVMSYVVVHNTFNETINEINFCRRELAMSMARYKYLSLNLLINGSREAMKVLEKCDAFAVDIVTTRSKLDQLEASVDEAIRNADTLSTLHSLFTLRDQVEHVRENLSTVKAVWKQTEQALPFQVEQ